MKKKINFTPTLKDLIILCVVIIAVFIFSYFFNVFAFLVGFFQQHPKSLTSIDEIITVLLTFSIGFAIFSWRRWLELREETAKRIMLQEELIKMAQTKAKTEEIISKQLRSEIELRKQEEASRITEGKRFK